MFLLWSGKRYVLKQDQPTCLPCYEDKFANKCEKCEKAIGTDYKVSSLLQVFSLQVSTELRHGRTHTSASLETKILGSLQEILWVIY